MIIFAIDPGTEESGYVLYDSGLNRIDDKGVVDNNTLARIIGELEPVYYDNELPVYPRFAIEMIASYGMPVGKDVFETCVWIGRFMEIIFKFTHEKADLIYRREVKMHLCDKIAKVNDAVIRQALIDLFPTDGGGKRPQVGTKAKPGPLYGVTTDMWAALGVAVTAVNK
jgi:hypothetical protein